MDLSYLTDKALLKDTEELAKKERQLTTKLLHHLKEIDKRRLYSDLKCSSLFDYCVRILGYAESSAQRRIQAARLLKELPDIEPKIDQGTFTLTNLSQAAYFFKEQNIKAPDAKREILTQIERMSKKECEQKLFEISGTEKKAPETKRRISKDKVSLTITLRDETVDKLQRVRGLLVRNLTQDELISLMADISLEKLMKKKFKISLPPAAVDIFS